MGAEHQRGAGRHVGQVFDEDGALGLEVVHHIGVVHDLVAHVDGRAEAGDGALDDLDGAVDAGAEAARLGQQHVMDQLGGGRGVHLTALRSPALQSAPAGRPAGG
jgi:hypothetical protein